MQLLLQVTCETGLIDYGLEMSKAVVLQGVSRVSSPLCPPGGNLGWQGSSPSTAVTSACLQKHLQKQASCFRFPEWFDPRVCPHTCAYGSN